MFHTTLPLLHPFVPFVTEELWEAFGYGYGSGETSIMRAAWPKPKEEFRFDAAEAMRSVQETVRVLRNLRAEARVAPQQWLNHATIRVDDAVLARTLRDALSQISGLCRVREIAILPTSAPRPAASLSSVVAAAEVSLPVGDVLDVDAEIARLTQEAASIEKTVASSRARLDKPDFVARAPQEVVEKERARVAEGEAQIRRIRENLESLSR